MGISTGGLGSGLDVNSIVTQLVALERQPISVLQSKQSKFNNQISAYGSIKSAISAFQTAASALKQENSLAITKAASSDEKVFSASAGSGAGAGSYSVVVDHLAQANKLISADALGVTDKTAAFGEGTLAITSGTNSFSVTIDNASGTSLEKIRDAINAKTENTSVVASILHDGDEYRLTLTSKESGSTSQIKVLVTDTVTGDKDNTGLSRLYYDVSDPTNSQLGIVQPAQNAAFTIDNINFSRTKNTFDDAVDGVTLTLKGGGTSTLSVSTDLDGIKSKVKNFVDAYNKLSDAVTYNRRKGGSLEADTSALSLLNQVRDIFNAPASISGNAYTSLSEIGVSFQKDGVLALDSTAFESAYNSKKADVQALFSDGTSGFALRLYDKAFSLLSSEGLLNSRTKGINQTIQANAARIDRLDDRATTIEKRLRVQYAALERTLSQLNQTSSYLNRQL